VLVVAAIFGVSWWSNRPFEGRFMTNTPPCTGAYAVREWYGWLIEASHYALGFLAAVVYFWWDRRRAAIVKDLRTGLRAWRGRS